MINERERVDHYRKQGWETEQDRDEPGKVYEKHKHERTTLYTVSGSLLLERDGEEPITLVPGSEVIVESGQEHRAVVGEEGWKYVAAWDPEEAKLYTHE